MKHNYKIHTITLSAMFLAIGLILPFFTGQIPQIGKMLLPMHIPVLLCGLICGWQYGLIVGFIVPLLRFVLFHAPQMPTALSMAFELAAYGAVIGYIYKASKRKCMASLYKSMLIAMIAGRIVWGIVQMLILGIGANGFTFSAFMAGAFFNAIPGIILQLVFIPVIMAALSRTGFIHFDKKEEDKKEEDGKETTQSE